MDLVGECELDVRNGWIADGTSAYLVCLIYSNFLYDNRNPELKQAEAASKEKQKFFFVTGSMLFSFSLLSKVFSA